MPKKIALFGGSFNPPGIHHRAIAEELTRHFDQVIVIPCGPRPDKPITNSVEPIYRATMVDMTFQGLPKVRVELFDLEGSTFTRTMALDEMFRSEGEVWHVVGTDLIAGGGQGQSFIQREWEQGVKLWKEGRFVVINRTGLPLENRDLPPNHRLIQKTFEGASSQIREQILKRRPLAGLVTDEVAAYLNRHGLYQGTRPARTAPFVLDEIRPLIVFDEDNAEAKSIAASLKFPTSGKPNLVLVVGGDGTMLRSIRKHWRLRLPFYGVNAGHLGFLLNDRPLTLVPRREMTIHQLPLLWVEMETLTGERRTDLAFNDAWIERATGQTAWIRVEINGRERVQRLIADAALVSTAAGSASYARAMGALPLPFNTPTLLLVGSNVLRPYGWKSAALNLDATVRLTGLDPEKRPMLGYTDGFAQGIVRGMTARLSHTAAVELVFEPEHDPAEKLARIQFPSLT